MLKQAVKGVAKRFGVEIRRAETTKSTCVTLNPKHAIRGNVLLSYATHPFVGDGRFRVSHSSSWECWQIGQAFLDRGYSIDVIYYRDRVFTPAKDYSFFIDELANMERLAPVLPRSCMKIFHIVWAHWLFHNSAQYQRYQNLKERRGISLVPSRLLGPNLGIEFADRATILGNDFTASTYRYAHKPLHRIPISSPVTFPWPKEKKWDDCRAHFLWFGGRGLVHKGLDLVLDAFAQMPEYHLTVCGQIHEEHDFERAYFQELYQTANIHTLDWIDVASPEFLELTRRCAALIFPSCSEGGGGGVITCMHAGLIPIVSRESSVDIEESRGVSLRDCSVEEIKESVKRVAGLPVAELERMSREAWEFARAMHTRERFADEYAKFVDAIIDGRDGENEGRIPASLPSSIEQPTADR